MIISHRYRFIFIKTRKTAGTSVEIALSRYCEARDVLTPTTPEDERMRADLGIYPRHYAKWPYSLLVGSRFNLHQYYPRIGRILGRLGARQFRQHMPASEIAEAVGPEIWSSYYKFTIERDPLDRIISRYYWDLSNGRCSSLEDFFERPAFDSNFDIYAIDGRPAVDKIIRFDQLTEGLNEVCAQIGIPFDGWMPRAKSGVRRDKKHWRDLLSEAQIRRVAQDFSREYEVMLKLGSPVPPEVEAVLPGIGTAQYFHPQSGQTADFDAPSPTSTFDAGTGDADRVASVPPAPRPQAAPASTPPRQSWRERSRSRMADTPIPMPAQPAPDDTAPVDVAVVEPAPQEEPSPTVNRDHGAPEVTADAVREEQPSASPAAPVPMPSKDAQPEETKAKDIWTAAADRLEAEETARASEPKQDMAPETPAPRPADTVKVDAPATAAVVVSPPDADAPDDEEEETSGPAPLFSDEDIAILEREAETLDRLVTDHSGPPATDSKLASGAVQVAADSVMRAAPLAQGITTQNDYPLDPFTVEPAAAPKAVPPVPVETKQPEKAPEPVSEPEAKAPVPVPAPPADPDPELDDAAASLRAALGGRDQARAATQEPVSAPAPGPAPAMKPAGSAATPSSRSAAPKPATPSQSKSAETLAPPDWVLEDDDSWPLDEDEERADEPAPETKWAIADDMAKRLGLKEPATADTAQAEPVSEPDEPPAVPLPSSRSAAAGPKPVLPSRSERVEEGGGLFPVPARPPATGAQEKPSLARPSEPKPSASKPAVPKPPLPKPKTDHAPARAPSSVPKVPLPRAETLKPPAPKPEDDPAPVPQADDDMPPPLKPGMVKGKRSGWAFVIPDSEKK